MAEHNFTPGPWHVGGKDQTIIFPEDGYAIADAKTYHGKHREGAAQANARLIAAAPDMFEALKDALRSSRKDFKLGPDGDRQHREAYAEQFAAIDKVLEEAA